MKKNKFRKWRSIFLFFLSIFLSFYLSTFVYSAFEQKPSSARPAGMGGAFVGLSNDTNAIDYNPAGLRLVPAFQFSSTYLNLYNVKGLDYSQAKFAFPLQGYGTVGALYSDFGPSEYKEHIFIFSHGFALAEGIMFGYNLKSMGIKIAEYGDDSAFGLDIGALARVSEDFALGVSAKNINEPEISKGHEKLTEEFLTGIFYRPLTGLNFAFDMEKVLDQPVALHIGSEFRLTDFFVFRTGIQTNPSQYAIGIGANYEKVYLDYGYISHATLDGMHVFSLSMKYGGEKEASLKYTAKKKKESRVIKKERVSPSRRKYTSGASSDKIVGTTKKVNINTASSAELQTLPDIGKVLAERIINYRTGTGQFKSIEDIMNVPRMSRRTYSKIEGLITLKTDESQPQVVPDAAKETLKEEPEFDQEFEQESPPAKAVPKTPLPKVKAESKTIPDSAPVKSGKIRINLADVSQLKDLGFTTVQSQNILRYIKKQGPLTSVDQLENVPGISRDIVDEVKDDLTVE